MANDSEAMPKARAGKLTVFSSLIALFLFFVSFIPLGISLSGILFIPEWVFFFIILYFLNSPHGRSYENQIVEIAYAKLLWHEDNSGHGWQKERILTYWKSRDIEDYLKSKGQNRIIAVMGSSRSGKSQLVYKLIQSLKEEKKIIFQFKATDNYTKLGYPTLYIHKAVPNVFVSPEAVARAFITAFPISTSMQGITASTVRGQVKQVAEKSKNWKDFKGILDELYQHETDSITKGALKFIQNNLPIIYRENVLNYELPEACVVDFEGSENTEVDMQFLQSDFHKTFREDYLRNTGL